MAEKTSTIKATVTGAGFFNETGRLKQKDELKDIKAKAPENKSEASSSDVVSKGLSSVDDRFRRDVDAVAETINLRAAQLKEEKESLKTEKKALQDLKEAFKNDDEEKAAKIKEEIKTLRNERDQRSAEIEKQQRTESEERSLRLGNKEVGRVAIPKLKLPESQKEIPQNAKEAKQQISEVKEDLQSVRDQGKELEAARKALSETLNAGRSEVGSIKDSSLRNIEAAQQSANRISSEAQSLTRDELLAAVAGKINPAAVAQALQS